MEGDRVVPLYRPEYVAHHRLVRTQNFADVLLIRDVFPLGFPLRNGEENYPVFVHAREGADLLLVGIVEEFHLLPPGPVERHDILPPRE